MYQEHETIMSSCTYYTNLICNCLTCSFPCSPLRPVSLAALCSPQATVQTAAQLPGTPVTSRSSVLLSSPHCPRPDGVPHPSRSCHGTEVYQWLPFVLSLRGRCYYLVSVKCLGRKERRLQPVVL